MSHYACPPTPPARDSETLSLQSVPPMEYRDLSVCRSQSPRETPAGDGDAFSSPPPVPPKDFGRPHIGRPGSPSSTLQGVELYPPGRPPPGLEQQSVEKDTGEVCPGCGSDGQRNLVVCIDGTSNQFSTKNTNVVELYSRLVKGENQLTFYNSGIGTYAKPSWRSWSYRKQVIMSKLDLAFALHFEKIIIGAYAWLADNYQPGDRIFLFGFSRGAYQVRALAAMIDIVGLLHKGNNDQIAFAYELYAASACDNRHRYPAASANWCRGIREKIAKLWKTSFTTRGTNKPASFPWPLPARAPTSQTTATGQAEEEISMQTQFKRTFSRQGVRAHFVGAWDTVSSVGFIRDKTLPSTTEGMSSVCFFRHALALHEFRVKFLPEYANGGAGPSRESTEAIAGEPHTNGIGVSGSHSPMVNSPEYTNGGAGPSRGSTQAISGEPHTKEVWFSGSHSDIGGGSIANMSLNKFGPALRWMSWEATVAGLRLDQTPDSWEPIGVSNSMTSIWRMVEYLPIKRLSYASSQAFTWLPHFCARREIQPFQRIHQSVYEECTKFSQPKEVLAEPDAYLILRPRDEVLRRGRILNEQRLSSLQQLVSSRDGVQSLVSLNVARYIYNMARLCVDNSEETQQILEDLRSLHVAYVTGVFRLRRGVRLLQGTVTETSPGAFPFHMCGHTGPVTSVAFLSDTQVFSRSTDATIRTWDVPTGKTLDSTSYNLSSGDFLAGVRSARGLVSSGSNGSTMHLDTDGDLDAAWDLHRFDRLGLAVAVSLDGSRLVSGSEDGSLRVWDATTREPVGEPVAMHSDGVTAVAFSSDGTRIVTGSHDWSVQLWEWSPGQGTPLSPGISLIEHTNTVWSVAFSPDARLVVSGSQDRSARLWDVGTGVSRFTLHGHMDIVSSVAFAPSGGHVVTGSHDWTVRVWDAHTGAAVRALRGHTHRVLSVAISPDGTRVASGSDDATVRLWDFDTVPDGSVTTELEYKAALLGISLSEERSVPSLPRSDQPPRVVRVTRLRSLATLPVPTIEGDKSGPDDKEQDTHIPKSSQCPLEVQKPPRVGTEISTHPTVESVTEGGFVTLASTRSLSRTSSEISDVIKAAARAGDAVGVMPDTLRDNIPDVLSSAEVPRARTSAALPIDSRREGLNAVGGNVVGLKRAGTFLPPTYPSVFEASALNSGLVDRGPNRSVSETASRVSKMEEELTAIKASLAILVAVSDAPSSNLPPIAPPLAPPHGGPAAPGSSNRPLPLDRPRSPSDNTPQQPPAESSQPPSALATDQEERGSQSPVASSSARTLVPAISFGPWRGICPSAIAAYDSVISFINALRDARSFVLPYAVVQDVNPNFALAFFRRLDDRDRVVEAWLMEQPDMFREALRRLERYFAPSVILRLHGEDVRAASAEDELMQSLNASLEAGSRQRSSTQALGPLASQSLRSLGGVPDPEARRAA